MGYLKENYMSENNQKVLSAEQKATKKANKIWLKRIRVFAVMVMERREFRNLADLMLYIGACDLRTLGFGFQLLDD